MTQKEEVLLHCEKQTHSFHLSQVYDALPHIPRPSIRALLQQVRDMGVIRFVDNYGTYALV